MPAPRRHLQPVEGEVPKEGPQTLAEAYALIAEMQDELDGLEAEKRSWRTRYQNLKRDKLKEAREDRWWGWAVALFWEWKIATGHMKSGWTADRFFLCKDFLERDGFPICRLAVWGIAANPNRKRITADYEEVYDSFELCFRNRDTFERNANRGYAIFGKGPPQDVALAEVVREWKNDEAHTGASA